MSAQITLITVHKGVDLHAATALRVMQNRLADGERLLALTRAEYYTFWDADRHDLSVAKLLTMGRFYNPNKHHYGHFFLADGGAPWFQSSSRGELLPSRWPGVPQGSDREVDPEVAVSDLYDLLLGRPRVPKCNAVDVCTYPLGEEGPLLAGVLWRLFMDSATVDPITVASRLTVTRGGREGLLVNPHMQGWRLAVCKKPFLHSQSVSS